MRARRLTYRFRTTCPFFATRGKLLVLSWNVRWWVPTKVCEGRNG